MADPLLTETVERRSFHALDGLRGVAALAVAFFHSKAYVAPLAPGSAYLAVDLFFVLSGFVLALAYQARLATTLSAARFMLMRVVRLYPLYLLGLGIAIVTPAAALILSSARNWTGGTFLACLLPALLFLPAPPVPRREPALYPFNAPAWSLFFELLVNLVFALTARRQRWLAPLLVVASAPLVVWAAVDHGSLDAGWLWPQWWIGTIRVTFSFFVGVVAYRAYAARALPRPRCPAWLALAMLAALLWFAPPADWRPWYDAGCVLALFPAVVWLAVCNEPRRGVRAYAALGIMSFPLYTIHVPVQSLALDAVDRLSHGRVAGFAPVVGLVLIGALVWISLLLARTYDVHARGRLGRLVGLAVPRVA